MDKQSGKQNQKKPAKKRNRNIGRVLWIITQVLIILGLMGFLFAGGVAAGFFAAHVQDEPVRSYDEIYDQIHAYNQTGEAYFKNDEFIGYLRTAEVSQPITLNEVSPNLINAILATEDHIFYEHNGINPKAITRAVIEMFTRAGEGTGGSTITQQLVKNQILDPNRSFERKFKEMLLAMRLERMFDKDSILESYMNIVYMGYNANGSNIEGVKAAADGIFDVDVSALNVAQSAYLAGMIHSPGRYTPFSRNGEIAEERLNRGLERMKFVLHRMLETQRITQKQYDEAIAFDIQSSLAKPEPGIVENYPFLTFEIERRAIDILVEQRLKEQDLEEEDVSEEDLQYYRDNARRQLSRGGIKVYTTIDRELYDAFHELAKDPEFIGPRGREHTYTVTDPETGEEQEIGYMEQTAATLIDNQTGAIIAMIEGRDFHELQYNLNTEPRQPGSSIKPLLDYGPAFETGILQPASVIDDAPIFQWDLSTNDYWIPRNWNNKYQGLVTVREAMRWSYNLPAIKALLSVQEEEGEQVPFDYLKKLGITTLHDRDYHAPSVAIGGMTYGLTVEESTSAFSTFANQGVHNKAYLIERIETFEGDVIYEHQIEPTKVFSEQTSFLMNDMLRTVVDSGTASTIRRGMGSDLDIAGKTGTTNDQYDYWFVGYTPNVSMGVWTGYDKRETLRGEYSARNQNLWVSLMKKVQEIRPEYVNAEQRFEQPDNIVRQMVCSKSGLLPSELCREANFLVTDYFNRQYLPTKVDDSLMEARIVTIDGENYLAQEETPDDFVEEGVYIKREPLEIPEELEEEKHRFLPLDWEEVAPEEEDPREENGKTPEQVVNVRANPSEEGIRVTWNPVADEDVVGYRIYRSTQDRQFVHHASVADHMPKAYVDTTADENSAYAYYVVAVDVIGQESEMSRIDTSNESHPDSFFVPDIPKAPTGIQSRKTLFGIELSWDANDGEENVERYSVYFTTDPANGFELLSHTASTSYTHSFFNLPDEFWYYITATNEEGESEPSHTTRVHFSDEDEENWQEPEDHQDEEQDTLDEEDNTPSGDDESNNE